MDKQKCLLIEHKHLSLQPSLITSQFPPGTNLAAWQKVTKLLSINVEKSLGKSLRLAAIYKKIRFFLFLLAFQWLIVSDRVGKCRGRVNEITFQLFLKVDFCFVPTLKCPLLITTIRS